MKPARLIPAVALALVLGGSVVTAQEPEGARPTIEFVQQRIANLEQGEQAGTLDEDAKARLQLYRQALESLQAAEGRAKEWERFVAEQAQAPSELEVVRVELAEPLPELPPEVGPDAALAEVQAALRQAEADLAAARETLKNLESEPQRRAARRVEIAEGIAGAQASLQETRQQLGALPLPDESPALTDARTARFQALEIALRERIRYLEEERNKYDAQADLLPLQREQWVRRVAQQDKLVASLRQIVEAGRAEEIKRQQAEAKAAAAVAHPLVAPIADQNVELARKRDEVRPASELAHQQLEGFEPDPDQLQEQLARMAERVEAVGMTSTVGKLLRKNRATLTIPRIHRRNIKQRQALMAAVEFDRLEAMDEYDRLVATREKIAQDLLSQLGPAEEPQDREAIEREIRAQLRTKRDYLNSLNDDLGTYFNRLNALNEKERRVAEITEEIAAYINERILWIRSSAALRPRDARHAFDALAWLVSPHEWSQIGRSAWGGARNRWSSMALALVALALLVAIRPRLRSRIRAIGTELVHPQRDTIGRTLLAAGLTVVQAATWPAAMWGLGTWLLVVDADAGVEFGLAGGLGATLRAQATFFFVLTLLWEACQKQGLAEAHFRWQPRALRIARRHLLWLMAVLVPASVVAGTMHRQPVDAWDGSLGRLAFVVAMIAMTVFARRVLRPKGGLLDDYLRRHPGGWLDRLRYFWYPLAVLTPLALIVVSVVGFHFTAMALARQVFDSIAAIVVISLANGLLLRWIIVAQRRLAREEMRKRRAAWEEQQAREEEPAGDAPAPPEEERVDVFAISEQTRHLVRTMSMFVVFVLLWVIWADVLPAIGFLEGFELWRAPGEAVAAAADAAPGGAAEMVVPMITLKDVLVAIVVIVLTVLISKNIPGLLEISILQRLPLDRGSQYAISTLVRYAITIVGVIVACGFVGMTWSKVQWLAAAVTVGLGFGLQEIFANFVSGLIILFERPIRVGDTVTAGNVHGTISRIRIRATTIVDWDRKELVIPNKEFVTGTIVNWSLSDPILRVVVPVGIAYGSDTVLAEKLLLQTATEHPVVLDEPPPTVVFSKFGDSSLEFDLRVFIPNIQQLFRVRHEIHNAIDRAFRKAGVEIAFPQRDIHVRSIRGEIPVVHRGATDAKPPLNDGG